MTLLATETIEARFKRCQEKTPPCDGKKTPACDEGGLSSSAQIKNGQHRIPWPRLGGNWLYPPLSTGEMPDNSGEITNRSSRLGCGFPVVSDVTPVGRSEFLDFIRYDNKLANAGLLLNDILILSGRYVRIGIMIRNVYCMVNSRGFNAIASRQVCSNTGRSDRITARVEADGANYQPGYQQPGYQRGLVPRTQEK